MRQSQVWVSILIVLVIGLHALPVLSYQGQRQTRWPFLAWAMYARSYPPGPIQVVQRRVIGTTASGEEVEITPRLVGLPRPPFRLAYLLPLQRGDTATARELMQRLNRQREKPFVRIAVTVLSSTLSDTGVVREWSPPIVYWANSGREATP
jgi:hypothetical protein